MLNRSKKGTVIAISVFLLLSMTACNTSGNLVASVLDSGYGTETAADTSAADTSAEETATADQTAAAETTAEMAKATSKPETIRTAEESYAPEVPDFVIPDVSQETESTEDSSIDSSPIANNTEGSQNLIDKYNLFMSSLNSLSFHLSDSIDESVSNGDTGTLCAEEIDVSRESNRNYLYLSGNEVQNRSIYEINNFDSNKITNHYEEYLAGNKLYLKWNDTVEADTLAPYYDAIPFFTEKIPKLSGSNIESVSNVQDNKLTVYLKPTEDMIKMLQDLLDIEDRPIINAQMVIDFTPENALLQYGINYTFLISNGNGPSTHYAVSEKYTYQNPIKTGPLEKPTWIPAND